LKAITFRFERRRSAIFGVVYRPVARVSLWSSRAQNWVDVVMLVDSGADYTLLPNLYAGLLGVRLERECRHLLTVGIGGSERVRLLPQLRMRLGPWSRRIPVGFLDHDDVPPLLGRMRCLDTFEVVFSRHRTTFRSQRRR
jgi:aspartyl protease